MFKFILCASCVPHSLTRRTSYVGHTLARFRNLSKIKPSAASEENERHRQRGKAKKKNNKQTKQTNKQKTTTGKVGKTDKTDLRMHPREVMTADAKCRQNRQLMIRKSNRYNCYCSAIASLPPVWGVNTTTRVGGAKENKSCHLPDRQNTNRIRVWRDLLVVLSLK